MLKGIHPLLHAELLHTLAAMGHGDELVIADANFPAASMARRLIHTAGASAPDVLDAVLTLLPLDTFVVPAALTMRVIDELDREAFYARARAAFAVVRTTDLRPYGNILLVKGVVNDYAPTAT